MVLWKSKLKYATNFNDCNDTADETVVFSTGFAEYWSGGCLDMPYGKDEADFTISGNTAAAAAALQKLRLECEKNESNMMAILKENQGKIFNYPAFHGAIEKSKLSSSCKYIIHNFWQ